MAIGTIFPHLFPIDGPALQEGRLLQYLFSLVIPVQRALRFQRDLEIRPSDFVLTVDLDFGAHLELPRSHTRRGKPLRFIDAGEHISRHPLTLRPWGNERIVNWPTRDVVINVDRDVVTLWPFSDQVHRGWWVDPRPLSFPGGANALLSDQRPEDAAPGMLWFDRRIKQLFVFDPPTGWIAASCCDDDQQTNTPS